MQENLGKQVAEIQNAIAALETQRGVLNDGVIDASVAALKERLSALEKQVDLPEQQRKLATLLFVDTVGSTRLYQGLDPEETRDIQDAALKRLSEPVSEQGGHVTRFMGDGFKAIFGVPLAKEDDPERAVRAGLGILEAARKIALEMKTQWGIDGYQVRVGINTGLVAVGGQTEAGDTVMGAPVNLAARLESAAPPGGVLISHNTFRHIAGQFEVEPLPPVTAKGFDEPVAVYLVKRIRPRSFYISQRGVEGVHTPMVGRDLELHLLQDTLYQILQSREGQVLTVVGDAGVGKSRLLSEFLSWVEALPESRMVFLGRSRQGRQSQPYALLRNLFSYHFDIQESDPTEVVHAKLEAGMAGFVPVSDAHIAGQLLGFDFSLSPNLAEVLENPQQLRDQGTKTIVDFFQAAVQKAPVILCLEDIHWADDSSLDLFDQLGRLMQEQRLLIVHSARGIFFERRPYWGEGQNFHSQVRLRPLSKWDSRRLVDEILQRVEDLPESLRDLVVSGGEGNPFYIEEIIKMLFEQGVIMKGETGANQPRGWRVEGDRLAQVRVPPTLAGVLQARLDSLPPAEREVLQQAAVVGRQFWDQAIEYIHQEADPGQDRQSLAALLASLRGRELIYHREASQIAGAGEFIFKHEVLREVTYESVPLRRRRIFHKLSAEWLLGRVGERLGEYTEQIAEHFEQAGQKKEAINCLLQAGDQAVARFANSDAIQYYRRGLELVDEFPEGLQRDELELEMCVALGVPLVVQEGYGNQETFQTYLRAHDLCLKLDKLPSPPVLRGLAIAYLTGGEPDKSYQCGVQLLDQAQQGNDSILYTEAHYVLGAISFWLGDFTGSKEHLELALQHYNPKHKNLHLARFSQDPKVICLVRLGITLWFLGFPDQALQKVAESLNYARNLGHLFSLAYALAFSAMLISLHADFEKTHNYALETLTLGAEHQINLFISMATPVCIWAAAGVVPGEADITGFSNEVNKIKNRYPLDHLSMFYSDLLTDMLERANRFQAGLDELDAALTKAERQGFRYLKSELLRRKGELLVRQSGQQVEAETSFQQALEVARGQKVRSLELRAALSLGQLWQEQGKAEAARELVRKIYADFEEGFDTLDLRRAARFIQCEGMTS